MTLFANTEHTNYGATLSEKRDALTRDFLRDGKTIDFVLTNVCGNDLKAVARALSVACASRFISAQMRDDYLKKFKINADGRKVK